MKKLLGIFAVSALTILGCTSAFASNSVQGDADSDGILTAKDSAYVLQKTLDSTFKVPMADEEYSVYCDVNGDKVVNADDASLILQKVLMIVLNLLLLVAVQKQQQKLLLLQQQKQQLLLQQKLLLR